MKKVYFASSLMWNATEEEMIETAATYGDGGIGLLPQQASTRKLNPEKLKKLAVEAQDNIYTGRYQIFNKGEDVFLGKKVS